MTGPAPANLARNAPTAPDITPPRTHLPPMPRLDPGARLRITQFIRHGHRDQLIERTIEGVLLQQTTSTTGSWFAHTASGKVELHRLLIQKPNGELTTLLVDERTRILVLDLPGA